MWVSLSSLTRQPPVLKRIAPTVTRSLPGFLTGDYSPSCDYRSGINPIPRDYQGIERGRARLGTAKMRRYIETVFRRGSLRGDVGHPERTG